MVKIKESYRYILGQVLVGLHEAHAQSWPTFASEKKLRVRYGSSKSTQHAGGCLRHGFGYEYEDLTPTGGLRSILLASWCSRDRVMSQLYMHHPASGSGGHNHPRAS